MGKDSGRVRAVKSSCERFTGHSGTCLTTWVSDGERVMGSILFLMMMVGPDGTGWWFFCAWLFYLFLHDCK